MTSRIGKKGRRRSRWFFRPGLLSIGRTIFQASGLHRTPLSPHRRVPPLSFPVCRSSIRCGCPRARQTLARTCCQCCSTARTRHGSLFMSTPRSDACTRTCGTACAHGCAWPTAESAWRSCLSCQRSRWSKQTRLSLRTCPTNMSRMAT